MRGPDSAANRRLEVDYDATMSAVIPVVRVLHESGVTHEGIACTLAFLAGAIAERDNQPAERSTEVLTGWIALGRESEAQHQANEAAAAGARQ